MHIIGYQIVANIYFHNSARGIDISNQAKNSRLTSRRALFQPDLGMPRVKTNKDNHIHHLCLKISVKNSSKES